MKATPETKAAAKEAGIKSWHVKSEEKLQKELAELTETVNTGETDENVVEEIQTCNSGSGDSDVAEKASEVDERSEEVTLPSDLDVKMVKYSLKILGSKSPYWKYKGLI
jgi:hypothetical protein